MITMMIEKRQREEITRQGGDPEFDDLEFDVNMEIGIPDEPTLFILNNLDRVFVAFGGDYTMGNEANIREGFEWEVPKPPDGCAFALIVRPTPKQKSLGCVCPGMRHNNKSMCPVRLDKKGRPVPGSKGFDLKLLNDPNPNMLYTLGGVTIKPLDIIEEKSGIRRRIRLVTYRKD